MAMSQIGRAAVEPYCEEPTLRARSPVVQTDEKLPDSERVTDLVIVDNCYRTYFRVSSRRANVGDVPLTDSAGLDICIYPTAIRDARSTWSWKRCTVNHDDTI